MGVNESREAEESDAESDPLVSVAAAMVPHLPDSAVELLHRVSAPSADPFIEKCVEDVVKRHAEALATELRDVANWVGPCGALPRWPVLKSRREGSR